MYIPDIKLMIINYQILVYLVNRIQYRSLKNSRMLRSVVTIIKLKTKINGEIYGINKLFY